MIAGGTKRNRSWMDKKTLWQSKCDETLNTILCDAQTSGGLLISVAEQKVQDLLNKMIQLGVIGTVIGNIVPMNKYHLEIT